MPISFTRSANLRPRLVRVVGHAGQPDWGMIASRKFFGRVDVVIVRAWGAPPRRVNVPVTWVTPASLQHAPEGVLANLVKAGTMTASEYATWMALRVTQRIEAEEWVRDCRTVRKRLSPWQNLARGMGSGEVRAFIR